MKQIGKTLYALNKDSSYQEWKIFVSDNTFTVHYGKENGKIQTKSTNCFGKNIGKANETSDEGQCLLEAEAKYRDQIRKGYKENKEDLTVDVTSPMLAQDASKKPHLIKYPCTISPKLDGCRCLVTFDSDGEPVFNSRGGKEYPKHKHLVEQLKNLRKQIKDYDVVEVAVVEADGALVARQRVQAHHNRRQQQHDTRRPDTALRTKRIAENTEVHTADSRHIRHGKSRDYQRENKARNAPCDRVVVCLRQKEMRHQRHIEVNSRQQHDYRQAIERGDERQREDEHNHAKLLQQTHGKKPVSQPSRIDSHPSQRHNKRHRPGEDGKHQLQREHIQP